MGAERFTDEQLLAQAAAGDREAVGELFTRYFDRVHDLVLGMVRNRELAADVAQTTFLKLMEHLNRQKEPPLSFRAWLYTIARNTALDELRRSKRVAPAPVVITDEGDELTLEPEAPEAWAEPGRVVADEETVALVWDAAAGLNPDDHALLDLNLRKGLDPGEIATVLGINPGAVYTKLNRLKAALEASVSALLLWRKGRRDCADLKALVDKYESDEMTPNLRKAINRHLGECDRCQGSRRRYIAAGALFSAVPLFVAPPQAKAAALAATLAQTPSAGPGAPAGAGQAAPTLTWAKGLVAAAALFGAGFLTASQLFAPAAAPAPVGPPPGDQPPPFTTPAALVSDFALVDATTGSDRVSRRLDLAVRLATTGQSVAWFLTEDAAAIPTAGDTRWQAAPPDRITLSPGDGSRSLFLWMRDGNGLASRSVATILIDTTPPSAPEGLQSPTHPPGRPSTANVVVVTWAPATEPAPGSGLAGYAAEWDNPGEKDPLAITLGPDAMQTVSPPLPPGYWYLLIRAVDRAGNLGPLERVGPFLVQPPRVAEPAAPREAESSTRAQPGSR